MSPRSFGVLLVNGSLEMRCRGGMKLAWRK